MTFCLLCCDGWDEPTADSAFLMGLCNLLASVALVPAPQNPTAKQDGAYQCISISAYGYS